VLLFVNVFFSFIFCIFSTSLLLQNTYSVNVLFFLFSEDFSHPLFYLVWTMKFNV
jgi:hypothetical protein